MNQNIPLLPLRILLVDDERTIRVTLGACLRSGGHEVVDVGTAAEALAAVAKVAFDLVFLDMRLGAENGLDLIPRISIENPWAKIVVITAYATVDSAVEAMKRGASDYLPKPFTPAQVELVTGKVAQQRRLELRLEALQQEAGAADPEADFPTSNAEMRQALDLARRVAATSATVLIRGETGTGKYRLARAIHRWSGRSFGPFASTHCQTARPEQFEAELFGTAVDSPQASDLPKERGGRVAFCEGGTLVLRAIEQTPMPLQPKLVRLLRDKEFERQGEYTARRADVRVVATSGVDLHDAARGGNFRADLAMAVDVVSINIPPLRQRPDDVMLLAERYLAFFAREHGSTVIRFSNDATDALKRHSYPGNSRELASLVERAVLICRGEEIELAHLPPNLLNGNAYRVGDLVPLETITDMHIKQVMASTRSYESAASVLGINAITLWRRRKRHGA